MSQPKRYWIDDHSAIEDGDGKWVLHSDYAALVQQGIRDHADWRSKLNFLEADYKAEIARLRAEKEAETRATFDAIRTITQLRDENEQLRGGIKPEGSNDAVGRAVEVLLQKEAEIKRLAAENEHLQGNLAGRDAMIMGRDSIIKCRDEEIERLRKLLEMYLKADPLIGEAVASAMLAAKEGKSV